MESLRKLREKKKDHKMHPLEKKAKMDVMEHLQKMAQEAMGGKLKGMHKVTIAADSPESLEHGLMKAQEVVEGQEDEDMYAEGGMTETHSKRALTEKNEHDPIDDMEEAEDDSHPDHENFLHSERVEDGDDGFSQYQDADGDHLLEMDEAKQHAHDETEEHPHEGEEEENEMYADGGAVMPDYNHMDEAMINRHLKQLLAIKKMKGLA